MSAARNYPKLAEMRDLQFLTEMCQLQNKENRGFFVSNSRRSEWWMTEFHKNMVDT